MADEVRKQVEAVHLNAMDIIKKGEYGKLAALYTEDATLMPSGCEPLLGRKEIDKYSQADFPGLGEMYYVKNLYFELMNDTTAMTTDLFGTKDSTGRTVGLFNTTVLWKKVDGNWLYNRELFNSHPLPKSPVQKKLDARLRVMFAAFEKGDYDEAVSVYTEDATLIPHGHDIVTGRQAIKKFLQDLIPPLKTLVEDKINYFNLLNDTTAYTNSVVKSVDVSGKIKAAFGDCLLWKKVDGKWYIIRDMFNERPLPSQ